MIFRNLTMAGFKSFAEKVEIDIDPGLTGIVGPNGCGKSNIVEAMRWIMGESSARQMRGTEMDDIIFAGTENRPARNLAEILLKLDNSSRTAPADFNNADEL
jgi:chromosome segregation protein